MLETRPAPGRDSSRRRVLAGEGMVTPREKLVLKENGRTEELIPGRHRFIRDHPLVLRNPELWKPADFKDTATFRHHRRVAERKLRRLGRETTGTTRATTSTRPKRFQLPDRRRERFRLP